MPPPGRLAFHAAILGGEGDDELFRTGVLGARDGVNVGFDEADRIFAENQGAFGEWKQRVHLLERAGELVVAASVAEVAQSSAVVK